MVIGYIYFFEDGTTQHLVMQGALNKLIQASNIVHKKKDQIVFRWTVKKKV